MKLHVCPFKFTNLFYTLLLISHAHPLHSFLLSLSLSSPLPPLSPSSQEHIAAQTPASHIHGHGHAQHRSAAKPAGEQIIESIALIDAKRREVGARLANTREYAMQFML